MKKLIAIMILAMMLVMSFAQAETYDFEGTWMASIDDNGGKLIWLLEVGPADKDGYGYASLTSMSWNTDGSLDHVNTFEGYLYVAKDGAMVLLQRNGTSVGAVGLTTEKYVLGYSKFTVVFTGLKDTEIYFKHIPTFKEDVASITGKF